MQFQDHRYHLHQVALQVAWSGFINKKSKSCMLPLCYYTSSVPLTDFKESSQSSVKVVYVLVSILRLTLKTNDIMSAMKEILNQNM